MTLILWKSYGTAWPPRKRIVGSSESGPSVTNHLSQTLFTRGRWGWRLRGQNLLSGQCGQIPALETITEAGGLGRLGKGGRMEGSQVGYRPLDPIELYEP